jgi:hypothetical protein
MPFYPIDEAKADIAVLNLGIDWADFLVTETITGATITLCADDTSGVTLGAAAFNATESFCLVSGGIIGATAKIEHVITTSTGEIQPGTLLLQIAAAC